MLSYTSGFIDDVTFGRNGPYGASGGQIPGRSLMSMNALFFVVSCLSSPENVFSKLTLLKECHGAQVTN